MNRRNTTPALGFAALTLAYSPAAVNSPRTANPVVAAYSRQGERNASRLWRDSRVLYDKLADGELVGGREEIIELPVKKFGEGNISRACECTKDMCLGVPEKEFGLYLSRLVRPILEKAKSINELEGIAAEARAKSVENGERSDYLGSILGYVV